MTVAVALYESSLVFKHQCQYSECHHFTISDILTDMLLKQAERRKLQIQRTIARSRKSEHWHHYNEHYDDGAAEFIWTIRVVQRAVW